MSNDSQNPQNRPSTPINVPRVAHQPFASRTEFVVPTIGGRVPFSVPRGSSLKGRGPKGYERSDAHLRHALEEALAADPTIDPSDVTVTVADGTITLSGSVSGRRSRHAVRAIAEAIGGPGGVKDALTVVED